MDTSMNEGHSRRRALANSSVSLVCIGVLVFALESYAELDTASDGNSNENHQGEEAGSGNDLNNVCQMHGKGVWEGQHLFHELSEAMPKWVGIVSSGFHIADTSIARRTAEPKCMNSTNEDSCWLELERSTDEPEWSLAIERNTSVALQGESQCANGSLSGSGTTTWNWTTNSELRFVSGEGNWHNGRQQGSWKYQLVSIPCVGLTHEECRLGDEDSDTFNRFNNGSTLPSKYVATLEGRYEDGARLGIWEAKFNNGDAAKIPYSNDLKHGSQTYTKVTSFNSQIEQLADHYEIPWVHGKKHGRQVKENTFGEREEVPWNHGDIHGKSVYSWATGERKTMSWVNGQQHEASVLTWPDGSRLTTLYDLGIKIGYEVLTLLPQSGADSISLRSRYHPDKHRAERTITRKLDEHQHGVRVFLSPTYGRRAFIPYSEGEEHGTTIIVMEDIADSYHFLYQEKSRMRSVSIRGQEIGMSVLIARDGFRQETRYAGGDSRKRFVIESSADGNYRSRLPQEGGLQMGRSIRCWHDNIPWSNEEMQGVNVYRWLDGRLGPYPWKFVSWHGPLSNTEPNGLCLETPYDRGEKSGIEIQTQTNGYKAHIPMRGRHIAGPIIVFRPDGSRREIPYESSRKHGVVYDFSASGEETRVEEYNRGSLVTE